MLSSIHIFTICAISKSDFNLTQRSHNPDLLVRLSSSSPGVRRSKFNFFRTWSCCISNKMESQIQQRSSKYLFSQTPPDPRGQNSTFSEQFHVAYQMQQHGSKYFARRPPPPPPYIGVQKVKCIF